MPKILNVPRHKIQTGDYQPSNNTVLISINDPAMEPPEPFHKDIPFKNIFVFEFLDVSYNDDPEWDAWKITDAQAEAIANILKQCYENGHDVLVHCTAGLCRSGAVVEAGVALGFDDPKVCRQPNLEVKHKIFAALGEEFRQDEEKRMKYYADLFSDFLDD